MPTFMKLSVLCTALAILGLLIERNSAEDCSTDIDAVWPRFYPARKGSTVRFYRNCGPLCPSLKIQQVHWYRGTQNGTILQNLTNNPSFHGEVSVLNSMTTLTINRVQQKDSGIYFCKFNLGERKLKTNCGSEFKVLEKRSLKNTKMRNTLKDAIIMIQTVLIVLFVSVPVLLIIDKNTRSDPMEEDHTYEGLEIEQTPMYEDIVTLRAMESKWTAAEYPCLE